MYTVEKYLFYILIRVFSLIIPVFLYNYTITAVDKITLRLSKFIRMSDNVKKYHLNKTY